MKLFISQQSHHKTIAEFRRKNKKALQNVLKQCARMCIKLDLIEGNTLFADGSKIRANASIKNKWTKERCEEALKKADENIDKILKECEDTDLQEEGQPSLIKMQKELSDHNTLKSKVNAILKELKDEQKTQHNTADPECAVMNSPKGTYSGYNAQIVVDEKHGLIVTADITNENNDCRQFAEQIDQANETLEHKCSCACADSGYANTPELEKIAQQNIRVIVPSKTQASKKIKPFAKKNFIYDKEKDCYTCPEGNALTYRYANNRGDTIYAISKNTCGCCRHFDTCTGTRDGKALLRLNNEELKEKFETLYQQPDCRQIYKLRKEKVELPFGHIKRNLNFDGFLLRGIDGVKAEISLAAACFNIARMITIIGVAGIIQKLQG